jgi:hypothetical protein
MPNGRTRFADLPRWQVHALTVGLVAVLAYGLYLSLRPDPPPEQGGGTTFVPTVPDEHEKSGADLKYYREIVHAVRDGANYYDFANERLRHWGFRVGSIFNWRLPTYAYVLGLLPGDAWVRGLLILIGLAGLALAGISETRDANPIAAACTVLLLFGVFYWCIDGDAYLAQEVWASMLILLSVAAQGLRWRPLAVGAGLAALFFRELALPYCLIAAGLAWWHGRRREALAWLGGVLLFGVFLFWHASQVRSHLTADDVGQSRGVSEWIQFGGLTFDILTTRMNQFLFNAPGWLVFLYLLMAVIGLIGWRSEQGALVALTTLSYLAAFSIVGMHKNINWGLMFAPLLPFGVVRAPAAIRDFVMMAFPDTEATRLKELAGEIPEPMAGAMDERVQTKDESIEHK